MEYAHGVHFGYLKNRMGFIVGARDMNENIESEDQIDKEQVRQLLKTAFSSVVNDSFNEAMLTHEDYLEIRLKLNLFVPEDVQWILPRVLEDLLDTHVGDNVVTEDAEFVLMYLNSPLLYVSDESDRRYTQMWGKDALKAERKSREIQRKISRHNFDIFTCEQAEAVYRWLLHVRNWPEFRDYPDDMEGALSYWDSRRSCKSDSC